MPKGERNHCQLGTESKGQRTDLGGSKCIRKDEWRLLRKKEIKAYKII